MNNRISLISVLLSVSWLTMASTAANYVLDLSRGGFPDGVTVEDRDGLPLDETCYKNGMTDMGWTVDRYGNQGYVGVSPTCSKNGGVQDNRMILSHVKFDDENVTLRWGACSIHPDFLESYDVKVVTSDGKETVVFTIDNESSEWVVRTIDLSDYSRQDVSIMFTATSASGYMLAVGEVEIGELTDCRFRVSDRTHRYSSIDDGKVKVVGEITNVGKSLDLTKIICKSGDVIVDEQSVTAKFTTGASIGYDFEVTPELNASTHYYICGVDASGNEVAIHDDSFFTSYFKRTLLVDKGTGMWCNNCPDGILILESLQSRYGSSLISVETHTGEDDLAQPEYWKNLGFYAAPYFKLNRNLTTAYSNDSKFKNEYEAVTSWQIRFSGLEKNGDDLKVNVKAESALQVDNSSDRYRVGYLLTRDYDKQPEGMTFYQANRLNTSKGKRFYYLPTYIPGKMMRFHDVTLPSEYAFTGIESSLPAAVEPYEEYDASWTIPVAGYPDDLEDINVVVYVLDRETRRIQNAVTMTLDQWRESASIDRVEDDGDIRINISADGHCRIDFGTVYAGDYELDLYTVTGARISAMTGVAEGNVAEHDFSLPEGIVIARLCAGNRSVTGKFIVR